MRPMFLEEAQWIERALARRSLPERATVLDVGSSSEEFRTHVQPHIEEHVLGPLRRRGAQITHLDAKHEPGIDVVADLTTADLDAAAGGRRFDLVLCCNMLEHVEDRAAVVDRLSGPSRPAARCSSPSPAGTGSTMTRSTPASARRPTSSPARSAGHGPADGGQGLGPGPLASLLQPLAAPARARPLVQLAFWLIPPLRWRQTCVLLERA